MKKILILTLLLFSLFLVTQSLARMAGEFEIPSKKVVKPVVPIKAPASSSSSTANGSYGAGNGGGLTAGQNFTDSVTGMELVWIPGGCFQMGSNSGDSDEKPVHKVCVDGFWIGRYEVTQGQWQKIMGSNPSYFKRGSNYPVEEVSWNDCQEFIKKLNRQSGKNFHLPTEAEWEYAARGGRAGEKYSGGNYVGRVANYAGVIKLKRLTHTVGGKAANGFGLYDMSGNVWEWCADWYGSSHYNNSPVQNPQGPNTGSYRVNRGGSWNSRPRHARSANRGRDGPGDRSWYLGFRLVSLGRR